MMLQALVKYYEQLLDDDEVDIARPGWCSKRIGFWLELSEDGRLVNVIPSDEKRGTMRQVPEQVKRSSGVAANVLCDTSSYLLGIDDKGKPERTQRCFEAAKLKNLEFLDSMESRAAHAVKAFFQTWDPERASDNLAIVRVGDALFKGAFLVFRFEGRDVLDDPEIQEVWNSQYRTLSDSEEGVCLITGERLPIARLHPAIKGVYGAQTMGASLVSFNERSYESYGHDKEQGFNAPVSEYAAFAYATALNYLLSAPSHHVRFGDTTIVYWCERHDKTCCSMMSLFLGAMQGDSDDAEEDPDKALDAMLNAISKGHAVADVDMDARFHILGLAPNAARLSVRFFHANTFGSLLNNVSRHYECLKIQHAPFEKEHLTPYHLLNEVENPNSKNKSVSPILVSGLMRAIVLGSPYPEALYQNALLRTWATQDDDERFLKKVTRGRAAIIKAYLMRNKSKEVSVELDGKRSDTPYVLGRLFAVFEAIQDNASPGLGSTLKNRFFNSASTTPASVFPAVIKNGQNHLAKLHRDNLGLSVIYSRLLDDLFAEIEEFPKRLTREEQGAFILGYYHQHRERFKGTENASAEE